jgi:hypothetical protein
MARSTSCRILPHLRRVVLHVWSHSGNHPAHYERPYQWLLVQCWGFELYQFSSCYIDIKEEETVRFSKLIFGDISADKFSLVTNDGSA